MVAWGVKNLETKSVLAPVAVTITPPQPKLIWVFSKHICFELLPN
jgi:hypothetical protein